jgi:hypothetical protein
MLRSVLVGNAAGERSDEARMRKPESTVAKSESDGILDIDPRKAL